MRNLSSTPLEPVAAAKTAAQWVAQQLDDIGTIDLACLVIDTEGSICGWLTAPRTDPAVLSALVLQSEFASAGIEDGLPHTAGTNAAAVLTGAGLTGLSIGMGGERCMEALTIGTQEQQQQQATSLLSAVSKRNGKKNAAKNPAPATNDRHAVLSIADDAARVFLSELDSLGIAPRHVRGLWHAMAAAWDPTSKHDADRPRTTNDANSKTIDAANTPVTAVILLDPKGRFHWAWSSEGSLLAANTFRIPKAHLHGNSSSSTAPTTAALAVVENGESHDDSNPILCTKAHASRLVADWIAWSLQLGISPTQILALGPEHALRLSQLASETNDPQQNGSPSLGQLLAERWPNATVSAIADADPIGSTIRRLTVTRSTGRSTKDNAAAADQPAKPTDDIVPLVERPTRVHRSAYRALAVCITALAILLAFVGFRLRAAGEESRQQATALRSQRTELLRKYESFIPRLRESLTPVDLLARETREATTQAATLTESRPVFSETILVLRAVMDVFIEQGLLDRAYDPRDLDAHLVDHDPFISGDDADFDDDRDDDLIPAPPAPPSGRIARVLIADARAPTIVIEIPNEAANRVAPALRDRLAARGSRIDWNYTLDATPARGAAGRPTADLRTVTFSGLWKRAEPGTTSAASTGSSPR